MHIYILLITDDLLCFSLSFLELLEVQTEEGTSSSAKLGNGKC